jgi:mRNA degradation ribonuclease J1/J2
LSVASLWGQIEVCMLQGEDRAQLNLASMEASTKLKLQKSDMILYSAKVIPGNDKRVMKMFNRISSFGARVEANRADGLHTRCTATLSHSPTFTLI